MRILHSQKGWIFFDLLIGIMIIVTALTALAAAYRQATVTTMAAKNYNQAVYIAQQEIESLKVYDGTTSIILQDKVVPPEKLGIQYTVHVSQVPISEPLNAKIIPVQVTVSWTEESSGVSTDKSVQLASYYYQK